MPWPEWLKYGPIERITGVFASAASPFGHRTFARAFLAAGG
jgi:hypothetical protein